MTQDEFYSELMQDVEYIFKTGFKLSPEMFMQTMSYASEQYELLNKRIAELEAPKSCSSCNDKSQCYTYRTLEEETTYILSCNSYKPKDIK